MASLSGKPCTALCRPRKGLRARSLFLYLIALPFLSSHLLSGSVTVPYKHHFEVPPPMVCPEVRDHGAVGGAALPADRHSDWLDEQPVSLELGTHKSQQQVAPGRSWLKSHTLRTDKPWGERHHMPKCLLPACSSWGGVGSPRPWASVPPWVPQASATPTSLPVFRHHDVYQATLQARRPQVSPRGPEPSLSQDPSSGLRVEEGKVGDSCCTGRGLGLEQQTYSRRDRAGGKRGQGEAGKIRQKWHCPGICTG